MPAVDTNVRVSGTGRGDSVSISGRSDDPVQVIVRVDGGAAVQANVGATIHGDGLNPIAATISGPNGQAVEANVGATISGGTTPVSANVDADVNAVVSGPGGKPIDANVVASATVTANVGGTNTPIKLDPIKLDVGLRDTTITFKLFGFIPLLTIKVGL